LGERIVREFGCGMDMYTLQHSKWITNKSTYCRAQGILLTVCESLDGRGV